jgi:Flp pilus assembly pilin Flp
MTISEERIGVTETNLLGRAAFSVNTAYAALVERTRCEQGVSTVQYALLVALVALMVALMVALIVGILGSGIRGLLGNAHGCISTLARVACKARPAGRPAGG